MAAADLDGCGEIIGGEDVVVIDKDKERSGGLMDTADAGVGQAKCRLDDAPGAGMPSEIDPGCNRFSGGVVDEDELPLDQRQCLGAQARECVPQVIRPGVVAAQDHGYGRREER